MAENLEQKSLSEERTKYSTEDAKKESLKYFGGDELAGDVFVRKYALKDSSGNIYESNPDQMHHRLAKEIARIENHYPNPLGEDEIYNLLKDFKYIIPQGSPMFGIGNDYQNSSLSNCFVVGEEYPNSDSYGAIIRIEEEQTQLMKRRGGVGHDLSGIRPNKSPVLNSALTSTGLVPFAKKYSNATVEVAQDGRRGALMLTNSSRHPDSEAFIDAKMIKGEITGANISVKIDDEFMKALKNGDKYIQQFPIDSENPKVRREIDPKELWDKIVHNAWESAEPGVLFWDTIIRESIPDCYADLGYKTTSTNPCGEIPLCPYDSCRLLAMNLYSYVKDPFTDKAEFNFGKFKKHAGYAQRIMDDIIDLEIEKVDKILKKIENDPEREDIKRVEKNLWKKIRHKAKEGRRIGIGITAEGDMLAALGLTYGTDEGNDFSEELHKILALEVYRSSVEMVKEGRPAFEIYDSEKEKDNPFINRIRNEDQNLYQEMVKNGRRNIALLTIAPTGSVSIMTQTTSGLEPAFSTFYKRRKKINSNDENVKVSFVDDSGNSWEEYNVFHHKFVEWMLTNNYDVTKEYSSEEIEEMVKKSPYYKATSRDVNWIKKVELQGRVQKWIDHSISVTINLPEDATETLVGKLYMKAWEIGCKGVTVYREGSREGVLISKKRGGELERITLVKNNVKIDPRFEIKPQAIKYKVKRPQNNDSLHFIITSDLYVDDKNKKAYFIPCEDFQIRAPQGGATSTSFAQSGMDRSVILKGSDPNYAELVKRWQSPFSNEDEGIGPRRIKSIEHAAGLVFEDCFTRNGIIGKDKYTGELVNLIKKSDLRLLQFGTEEYKEIISKIHLGDQGDEITINGNHGKLDVSFKCQECGGTKFTIKEGCGNPVCIECGWFDPNKSCG